DELLQVNKTNVIQALQAFDPSFRIGENLAMGSDPNALPEVSIRGNSGLGAGELDIDVTNKASLKNNPNLPTFIMDGFEISVTKLYDMDPSRIESITILKDAAATAMYGSRAANGVVVITTVTPKPGKLNVSYSFIGEVEMPDLTDYDLLNAREKLELEQKAGCFDPNSGHSINGLMLFKEYNAKLYNIQRGIDTYWLSQPLRTAFNQTHSLYVDGGS
ncbi:protein containing TonB-dependent receptor, plug domain protein, partial [gut metagenome]